MKLSIWRLLSSRRNRSQAPQQIDQNLATGYRPNLNLLQVSPVFLDEATINNINFLLKTATAPFINLSFMQTKTDIQIPLNQIAEPKLIKEMKKESQLPNTSTLSTKRSFMRLLKRLNSNSLDIKELYQVDYGSIY